jgi:hypothetical protein
MATIKITYLLTQAGQRACLLAGGDGKSSQTATVEATPALLALADIADDGSASYDLSTSTDPVIYCSIDRQRYDAPITDGAAAIVAEEARRATLRSERAARRAQEEAEAQTRGAQQIAERAAATAEWRALAARYSAGEDLPVTITGSTRICNIAASQTDVAANEWQAVDSEYKRREAAAAEVRDREQAEIRARLLASRLTWLRDHSAAQDVIERLEAGVLPQSELEMIARDALLPSTIGGVSEYEHKSGADIDHKHSCEYQEGAEIKWTVEDGPDYEQDVDEWAHLKAVREHYSGSPVVVDVRAHKASLSCNCPDPVWLLARATLALPELGMTVRRQYAL